MIRITRGKVAAKKHKKFLNLAKGYVGANSRLSTMAMEQFIQSGNFAYIGRRLRKRDFRKIWISRINIAVRSRNNMYSKFIGSLHKQNILLNRKSLAFLAFQEPSAFNLIERISKL